MASVRSSPRFGAEVAREGRDSSLGARARTTGVACATRLRVYERACVASYGASRSPALGVMAAATAMGPSIKGSRDAPRAPPRRGQDRGPARWSADAGVEVVTLCCSRPRTCKAPPTALDPLLRIISDIGETSPGTSTPRGGSRSSARWTCCAGDGQVLRRRERTRGGPARGELAAGTAGGGIADAVRSWLQQNAAAGTAIEELAGARSRHIAEPPIHARPAGTRTSHPPAESSG